MVRIRAIALFNFRSLNMEDRIIDLQQKFSHQEMLLEELNEVVTSQQKQIDRLSAELNRLRDSQLTNENATSKDAIEESPPPHY